ncbi:MAG: protein-methionine-sulfoxide reductase catalytic subunit MsrP [Acidobacteria bacterium Pan2503]|uniref:Protein-methionine-sulfoxide reductase catalytic subunit MsrP n=1 Tax=Candidatus Acidiferrum panamense TaxID=2741543 RepID=A0A7V8NTB3_9BACT|nr:protein-methionine-sulfoxide reductase catalytic subunit MsrP [Candidatus Acidoferrum panamensis]
MLIRKPTDLTAADITPKQVYLNRRRFLEAMGIVGATAVAGSRVLELAAPSEAAVAATKFNALLKSPFSTTEKENSYEEVTHYNNFYEFGTDKTDPAKNAQKFDTSNWMVSVEGEVAKCGKFSMDEILKIAPLEERIYRHRCVEAWSIVVPWIGFSFSHLINLVEPTPKAKFVAFQSYYDHRQMPQGKWAGIEFPYVEGLRLDEAMNPLTLLCVGMYGESLPNQDGAPVRLVIPWKYGFKSIKSLVKIKFQSKMPATTWNLAASNEYGFYSNVNPNVDHPRWRQNKERRLGELFRRNTLMFNGYGDQVSSLYSGMDLKKYY